MSTTNEQGFGIWGRCFVVAWDKLSVTCVRDPEQCLWTLYAGKQWWWLSFSHLLMTPVAQLLSTF